MTKKINKKNNENKKEKIKNNKKNFGAVKKSAPKNNKNEITFDDEYFIGMPKNNKKYPVAQKNKLPKKKKIKKVKKLSPQQQKRKKAILKAFRWTCLIIVFIGIVVCILLSPLFSIKKITVSTDGNLTEQEIISLSAINLNENIFKHTKKQIKENIMENSYVEDVNVERKLPNEIKITINERVPKFMITYGNAYVYIDSQGYMLEISKEYMQLPILKGIKTTDDEIELGKRLCNEDLEKLTTVLKITEVAKTEGLLELITSIDMEDTNEYKIIMDSEEKTIYLGDCSSLDERMLWVKKILEKEKGIAGEIIVNMNLNLDQPFFRERV